MNESCVTLMINVVFQGYFSSLIIIWGVILIANSTKVTGNKMTERRDDVQQRSPAGHQTRDAEITWTPFSVTLFFTCIARRNQ